MIKISANEIAIYKDGKLYCIEQKTRAETLVKILNECFEGNYTTKEPIPKEEK